MGNKLFKSKSKKFEYNGESGASSSGTAGTSSNGSRAASASATESARHKGPILGISCVEDRLISCSDDNALVVSSALTKGAGPLSPLIGHKRAVNRVVGFKHAPSGKVMCWSASRDLSIRCWDLSTGACVKAIEEAHSLNIAAIAVGADTSVVYSGSRDYGVKGWEWETGKAIAEFSAPRNIVTTMEYAAPSSSGSSLLFQGSEDLCVRAWDTKSKAKMPAMHITGYVYFPTSMSVHPGGQYLATGCKGFDSVGCEVKIWDLRKCTSPVAELKGHSHDVTAVRYISTGNSNSSSTSSSTNLISVSKDGSVIVWQPANDGSMTRAAALPASFGRNFTSIAVLPDTAAGTASSPQVALGAFDGSISFYKVNSSSLELLHSTPPFASNEGEGGGVDSH